MKELLQQKAEDNPELYDSVKKDKYDECIKANEYCRKQISDLQNECFDTTFLHNELKKQNKELKEKVTELEAVTLNKEQNPAVSDTTQA